MRDCINCKFYKQMPKGARCRKCDNGSLFKKVLTNKNNSVKIK